MSGAFSFLSSGCALACLAFTVPALAGPITSVRVAAGLSQPLFATAAPGDVQHLFVVEKTGRIQILDLNTNTVAATPFLDISGEVSTVSEQGLLGLAFHPDYAANGLLYVNFTDTAGDTVVRRYQVSAADPGQDRGR